MKLYYSPGACSLAAHIVLHELGLPVEAVRVDLKTKQLAAGGDFLAVNPKGYVPVLQFDDGSVLTENVAILLYLADRDPATATAPGDPARYRLVEWLGFINSELHKGHSPLFHPGHAEAEKQMARDEIGRRYDWLNEQLEGRSFLHGDRFSVADAYLYTVLGWGRWVGLKLERWPQLQAFFNRIGERPAVKAAQAHEHAGAAQ